MSKRVGLVEQIWSSKTGKPAKIIKLWIIARLYYKNNKGQDAGAAWSALASLLTYDLSLAFGIIASLAERLAERPMTREQEITLLKELVPELRGKRIK